MRTKATKSKKCYTGTTNCDQALLQNVTVWCNGI